MIQADILVKGKDGQGYITLEQAIKRYGITYENGGKQLALTNKPLILAFRTSPLGLDLEASPRRLEYPGFTIVLRNIGNDRPRS